MGYVGEKLQKQYPNYQKFQEHAYNWSEANTMTTFERDAMYLGYLEGAEQLFLQQWVKTKWKLAPKDKEQTLIYTDQGKYIVAKFFNKNPSGDEKNIWKVGKQIYQFNQVLYWMRIPPFYEDKA